MPGESLARIRDALEARGSRITADKGHDFMAQCPTHHDRTPSLHVTQGRDGVVLKCHAPHSCTAAGIAAALGLRAAELFDEPRRVHGVAMHDRFHPQSYRPGQAITRAYSSPDEPADNADLLFPGASPGGDRPGRHVPLDQYGASWRERFGAPVVEYAYRDGGGAVRAVVVRTDRKSFPCYTPATRRWSLGDDDAKRALAALPYGAVRLAGVDGVRGRTLYIAEGEKDVEALFAAGLHATTNLRAAGTWSDALSMAIAALSPAQVVVIEDRDRDGDAGARRAAEACDSLRRVLPYDVRVKRILLTPVFNGYRIKDAADFLEAGGTHAMLMSLADAAPPIPTWLDTFAPRADVLMANPELLAPPPAVVPRLAWRGRTTLLASEAKAGKSTLVGQAVAALTRGKPFLDGQTSDGRVLWFALDESEGDALRRLRDHGFDAAMVRITREVPTPVTMRQVVTEYAPAIVVIDALSDVLQSAGKDENSPESGQYLKELCVDLAYETGTAFVVIHHAKKGDRGARGSGSISAKVDVIVLFSRPTRSRTAGARDESEPEDDEPGSPEPRVLTARGRGVGFGVKLHYDGCRYALEKSPASDALRVLHVLLNHVDGLSKESLRERLSMRNERVIQLIAEHEAAGRVMSVGKGKSSRVVITPIGRDFVAAAHPGLAEYHLPTVPDLAMEEADLPLAEDGREREVTGNGTEEIHGEESGEVPHNSANLFRVGTPGGVHWEEEHVGVP